MAAGTAHPRSLTAPLSSSGVAVELEELLPETMENGTTNHMIILQGETVLLPCKAYSLGQRTVNIIPLPSRILFDYEMRNRSA